jgi:hypothetical protein
MQPAFFSSTTICNLNLVVRRNLWAFLTKIQSPRAARHFQALLGDAIKVASLQHPWDDDDGEGEDDEHTIDHKMPPQVRRYRAIARECLRHDHNSETFQVAQLHQKMILLVLWEDIERAYTAFRSGLCDDGVARQGSEEPPSIPNTELTTVVVARENWEARCDAHNLGKWTFNVVTAYKAKHPRCHPRSLARKAVSHALKLPGDERFKQYLKVGRKVFALVRATDGAGILALCTEKDLRPQFSAGDLSHAMAWLIGQKPGLGFFLRSVARPVVEVAIGGMDRRFVQGEGLSRKTREMDVVHALGTGGFFAVNWTPRMVMDVGMDTWSVVDMMERVEEKAVGRGRGGGGSGKRCQVVSRYDRDHGRRQKRSLDDHLGGDEIEGLNQQGRTAERKRARRGR